VKLEGSLDAFSLPDIFQLLSFTKKSGGLHLRRASTHGCVYFRDGAVTGATSDDGRQPLARRLVGSSAIGDSELTAAVDRSAAEGVGVGRALLEAGAIDHELLRGIVAEQAVDAVFDFLRWSEGDFSFTVDEPGPDDVGVLLGVEGIVADARGRLEAWDRHCQIIPSPDTVLALPVAVREDPQVSRGEWALLALADGRRTVADFVSLAGRGDFAVVSQLAGLVERGLLAIRTPESEEDATALARRYAILARLETTPGPASSTGPNVEDRRPEPQAPAAPFEPAPQRVDHGTMNGGGESVYQGVSLGEVSSTSTVASVLAAAAAGDSSPYASSQEAAPSRAPENGGHPADRSTLQPGRPDAATAPRLVADTRGSVTPARPEPFMPRRRPDFPEDAPLRPMGGGSTSAAVAADPASDLKSHIERDPSVNKSLLLRLIAGVRGL
jgi:hypothetical protein